MTPDDRVRIPPGHRVTVTWPSPIPEMVSCVGGARVAHLGVEGDEQDMEVNMLFKQVLDALREPSDPVMLVAGHGALSDLFAPHRPPLQRVPSLLVWTGMNGCFAGFVESAKRLQDLMRLFYEVASLPQPPLQVLYLTDTWGPNARLILSRLRGMGVSIRTYDPQSRGILLEVVRPDGVVTALMGSQDAVEADTSSLTLNQQKDAAATRGDEPALVALLERERASLERGRAPVSDVDEKPYPPFLNTYARTPGKPVHRCGRLRVLTLNALVEPDNLSLVVELAEGLLASPYPLLAMCDAQRHTLLSLQLVNGPMALPIFTDVLTLEHAARRPGAPSTGGFVEFSVAKVCQQVFNGRGRMTLGVLASAQTLRYMLLSQATVEALAQGRPPDLAVLARERTAT